MGGNGNFLEKSATFLKVVGGKRGVASNTTEVERVFKHFITPRDAAVVDAAIEATYGLSDRSFDSGRARVKVSDEGWGEQCG